MTFWGKFQKQQKRCLAIKINLITKNVFHYITNREILSIKKSLVSCKNLNLFLIILLRNNMKDLWHKKQGSGKVQPGSKKFLPLIILNNTVGIVARRRNWGPALVSLWQSGV